MGEKNSNSPQHSSFAVVTDSASDIPIEFREKYRIAVIPFYVGQGWQEYRDGIDINSEQIYRMQRDKGSIFRSSAPSPRDFYQVYQQLLNHYPHVLSIHISSRLSALINSAHTARKLLQAASRITIYDSMAATMGCGLMAMIAAKASLQGYTLDKTLAFLNYIKANINLYGTLDTLKFLSISGRVPAAASHISSWLHLKPLLGIKQGKVAMTGLAITRKGSLKAITSKVIRNFEHEQWVSISLIHSLSGQEAEIIKNILISRLNCTLATISQCTPVIGAHTGPGLMGIIACRLNQDVHKILTS